MNTNQELKEEFREWWLIANNSQYSGEVADWWLTKLEAQKAQAYQEGVTDGRGEMIQNSEGFIQTALVPEKAINLAFAEARSQLLAQVLEEIKPQSYSHVLVRIAMNSLRQTLSLKFKLNK